MSVPALHDAMGISVETVREETEIQQEGASEENQTPTTKPLDLERK